MAREPRLCRDALHAMAGGAHSGKDGGTPRSAWGATAAGDARTRCPARVRYAGETPICVWWPAYLWLAMRMR